MSTAMSITNTTMRALHKSRHRSTNCCCTVSMALTPFDDDASCLEEPTFEAEE